MRIAFQIAYRFLKSNKGQTLLIILGIAIGVSVQIFIGSLIQGLQKGLVEKTIGNSSQITITAKNNEVITDYMQLSDIIRSVDPRISEVSFASDHAAFLEYQGLSQSILIRGFDIKLADGIYNIVNNIKEGTYPKNKNEIILGLDLKKEYGFRLNDEATIITVANKSVKCRIVGFFDLNVSSLNTGWGITTLDTARGIFETGDSITSIEMQVNSGDVFKTDEIATNLNNSVKRTDLEFSNWKDENKSLLSGLQGQSISSYMIQVFVIISVVLGISSVLAITVLQKSKQIGILKAMGIRNRSTSYIFLFEGLILGFFGAILGIILGLGLSYAFTYFAVNPDGSPVVELYISDSFILISGLIAVSASIMAALIPAIRSSKMNPIDIIRNN